MKKILLLASFSVFSASAMAEDFHQNCVDYFKAIEESKDMPAESKKMMLDTIKPQFAALPKEAQAEACKQALADLKESAKEE
ncbi:hypothetical protein A1D29_01650 [Pasteurellaceae bacterium Orientalotternb1]|nr:hypothetical protein A1D29_01650 [Pasteurellaceae bacterium Orientalotternb1]